MIETDNYWLNKPHNGNCYKGFCPVTGYNYKIVGTKKIGKHYGVPIRKFLIDPESPNIIHQEICGITYSGGVLSLSLVNYPDVKISGWAQVRHNDLVVGDIVDNFFITHYSIWIKTKDGSGMWGTAKEGSIRFAKN
jgi:hypothetical protein